MKRNLVNLLILFLIVQCNVNKKSPDAENETTSKAFIPYIEISDSALVKIIDPSAAVEIIAEGFDWTEGPLWVEGLGLLFSDIPPNKIFLWTEKEGAQLYLTPSGYTGNVERGGEVGSNGLLLDHNGKLILCQHGDRRLARLVTSFDEPKPTYETIVDAFEGKKLNSPNDACISSLGYIYFTDPPYGLEYNMNDPLKELDFQGVYRYSPENGLTLLTEQMTRPNGIAFSPDEKTLYVANSDPEKAIWMRFELGQNGQIISQDILYDATAFVGKEAGLPDGLKVDHAGNIFATGPGGVWIFDKDGNLLGKIKTGQATSNCAIGNNGKILYITADMYVMKVNLR